MNGKQLDAPAKRKHNITIQYKDKCQYNTIQYNTEVEWFIHVHPHMTELRLNAFECCRAIERYRKDRLFESPSAFRHWHQAMTISILHQMVAHLKGIEAQANWDRSMVDLWSMNIYDAKQWVTWVVHAPHRSRQISRTFAFFIFLTKEQAEQGAVSLPALHERVKTDMKTRIAIHSQKGIHWRTLPGHLLGTVMWQYTCRPGVGKVRVSELL